jgi:cell division protein FtsB
VARGRKSGLRKLVFAVVMLTAAYFAIEGGEYSTSGLFRQRSRRETLTRAIDSVQREVDSLKELKRRAQSDPEFMERVAREQFGMVKGSKELRYRFYDADSMRAPTRR